MTNEFYSSRAFSLPRRFFTKNFSKLKEFNDKKLLHEIFDNNRYVKRERLLTFSLGEIKLRLFDKHITLEHKVLVHSSDNIVVIANIKTKEALSFDEIEKIRDNWIPKESIFSYGENPLNIRDILNYGLFLFLAKLENKILSIKEFLNLEELKKYEYEDKDIQTIEKIYKYFSIKKDYFYIPSMYGTSFLINNDNWDKLNISNHKTLDENTKLFLNRNYTFLSHNENSIYYCYCVSFFNLLKHLKNRIGSETSIMLDDIASTSKSDYPELLERSSHLQRELTVNYDEFNNINIWHNEHLLKLSKNIRAESGWNLAKEFEENHNKLKDFIELTTEMSKGKFQSFMDTISLLIGILGIFAFFDLVQVLNSEPYKDIHWLVSFTIIIILLPIFLIFMAKKSNAFMRFINKFL